MRQAHLLRLADECVHGCTQIGQPMLPLDHNLFNFGSWMGGDRDGNPFVTPETTRDVVITARLSAVNLFFSAIEKLMFELSIWRCNKELSVRGADCCIGPSTFLLLAMMPLCALPYGFEHSRRQRPSSCTSLHKGIQQCTCQVQAPSCQVLSHFSLHRCMYQSQVVYQLVLLGRGFKPDWTS